MNPIKLVGMLLLFVFVMVAPCSQAPAEPLNRIVAVVNNDVITLHELNSRVKDFTGSSPDELRARDPGAFLDVQRQVLELLIDDRIAQDKIRQLGIKVSARQIEDSIETIRRDNNWTREELLERLAKAGIPFEKYKENVRKDLERIQLLNYEVRSKIIIREEAVASYYQEHKEEFGAEEKVHLGGIFLTNENPGSEESLKALLKKGEELLDRLKKGEDFAALAREFSQGPGAEEGGDLGTFNAGHLEPELRKILEGVPEGGVSDLIVRPNGVQIVKLIKREVTQVKPLEEVKNAIFSMLFKREVDRRYMAWIQELRKNTFTKITL